MAETTPRQSPDEEPAPAEQAAVPRTREEWIQHAFKLENRRNAFIMAALEEGRDASADPDLQFTLGALSTAYEQVRAFEGEELERQLEA